MKLGALKKPPPPKTKEQKEKEQQQQGQDLPNPIVQEGDIEKLTLEIQKVYGNRFSKEEIMQELKNSNMNKSVAIDSLIKYKEQIEKLEEKLAAQKIQQVSTTNVQKEKVQVQNTEMSDFYGYKKTKENKIPIFVPDNLLQQIEQNFKIARPVD